MEHDESSKEKFHLLNLELLVPGIKLTFVTECNKSNALKSVTGTSSESRLSVLVFELHIYEL